MYASAARSAVVFADVGADVVLCVAGRVLSVVAEAVGPEECVDA
jgi:hypothetical protein